MHSRAGASLGQAGCVRTAPGLRVRVHSVLTHHLPIYLPRVPLRLPVPGHCWAQGRVGQCSQAWPI